MDVIVVETRCWNLNQLVAASYGRDAIKPGETIGKDHLQMVFVGGHEQHLYDKEASDGYNLLRGKGFVIRVALSNDSFVPVFS